MSGEPRWVEGLVRRRAWMAGYVGWAMIAQFVPLTQVVGYEYAVWLAAGLTVAGTLGVLQQRPETSAWREWGLDLARLAGWLVAGLAIGLANMVRVRNCEPGVGVVWVLVLAGGAVPLIAAMRVAIRRLPSRRGVRIGFVGAVWAVSVVSAAGWLWAQPPITVYHPFLGWFAGSIYDEGLSSFGPHVAYRGWTLLSSLLVLSLLAFAERPSPGGAWRMVALAAGLAGVWSCRDELGIERSRAAIASRLGGVVQTAHFDIHYDEGSFPAARLDALVRDHEARYEELRAYFGVTPPGRLRSWVYGDRDQKGEMMGGRNTLVAKIWLGEMHITWSGIGDPLLAHEMAHLFLREAGRGPLRVSSRDGLLPMMGLVEGAAQAAAWGGRELDDHASTAALYRLGLADPPASYLAAAGFWGRPSRTAYAAMGSFCRWLIETRGMTAFLDVYRDGDFQRVYGLSPEVLAEQWRAFLEAIPLTAADLESVRYRFDRPAIFRRVCARSVATRLDEADRLLAAGRREALRVCLAGIDRDVPDDLPTRIAVAQRYAAAGMDAEAIAAWAAIEAHPRAGEVQRMTAREARADALWRSGDPAGAAGLYEALLASPLPEDRLRAVTVKRVAIEERAIAPWTERGVRSWLVDRQGRRAETLLAELLAAHSAEGRWTAAYLAGLHLSDREGGALAAALLSDAERGPLTEALRARATSARALALSAAGDRARACAAWQDAWGASRGGTSARAVASQWLERCHRGTWFTQDVPGRQLDGRSRGVE